MRLFYFFNILNLARYKKIIYICIVLNLKNYNMKTVKDLRDFFNNLLNKLSNYDENQCMKISSSTHGLSSCMTYLSHGFVDFNNLVNDEYCDESDYDNVSVSEFTDYINRILKRLDGYDDVELKLQSNTYGIRNFIMTYDGFIDLNNCILD